MYLVEVGLCRPLELLSQLIVINAAIFLILQLFGLNLLLLGLLLLHCLVDDSLLKHLAETLVKRV